MTPFLDTAEGRVSLVVKDIGGLCGEVCWPITLPLVITDINHSVSLVSTI